MLRNVKNVFLVPLMIISSCIHFPINSMNKQNPFCACSTDSLFLAVQLGSFHNLVMVNSIHQCRNLPKSGLELLWVNTQVWYSLAYIQGIFLFLRNPILATIMAVQADTHTSSK